MIFVKSLNSFLIFSLLRYKSSSKIVSFNKQKFLALILLFYIFLSILWSENSQYGLLKSMSIITSLMPFLFINNFSKFFNENSFFWDNSKIIYFIVSFIAIYIIISQPIIFNSTGYVSRDFSHVFIGRILIFLSLVILFNFFFGEKRYYLLHYFTLVLISYSFSILGYRSGYFVLISVLLYYFISEYKFVWKQVVYSILIVVSVFVISNLIDTNISKRVFWVTEVTDIQKIEDTSIKSRIEAFNLSISLFKKNLISGSGIGSFNSEYGENLVGIYLKYPHNLFLEILSELGLIGLLLFSVLMYYTTKFLIQNQYKTKRLLITVLINVFILSMFSKSLITNIILIVPSFYLSSNQYFNSKIK